MEDDVARLGGSLGARSENDVPARRERNGGAEAAVDHGSFEAYRTAGELDLLARLGAATQDTGEGPGLTAALVEVHLGERRVAQGSRLAARTEQQSEEESDAECGTEERGRGAVHQMNERRQSTTAMMPRPEDALGSSMVESGVPSACGAVNTKHPLLLPSREGNCMKAFRNKELPHDRFEQWAKHWMLEASNNPDHADHQDAKKLMEIQPLRSVDHITGKEPPLRGSLKEYFDSIGEYKPLDLTQQKAALEPTEPLRVPAAVSGTNATAVATPSTGTAYTVKETPASREATTVARPRKLRKHLILSNPHEAFPLDIVS